MAKTIAQFLEQLNEGMPLKGHPYHSKTDDELRYIQKDAGEAAEAMKGHDEKAENKYRDQVNDASTVLHYRKNGGKRVTEDRERSEHLANLQLSGDSTASKSQGEHHIYVTSRGQKKSIAGPFASKEEAERHPARKWGDGVATSDQL